MENTNFYGTVIPYDGEIVQVIFTEHNENHIDGHLIDYPCSVVMTYNDVTKKKNVSCWHQYAPLNKKMIARVENTDRLASGDIVQVSLIYIEDTLDKKYDEETKNKILNKQFVENKLMKSFIKKFCTLQEIDFDMLWSDLIHELDRKRRVEYEDNFSEIPTLWSYFTQERESIKDILEETNYEDVVYEDMMELLDTWLEEKPRKLFTKIGIVSLGGVNQTKLIIKKTIDQMSSKFDFDFWYDTAPNFVLESSSINSTVENHQEFYNILESESKKIEPKIFVKLDKLTD